MNLNSRTTRRKFAARCLAATGIEQIVALYGFQVTGEAVFSKQPVRADSFYAIFT